MNQERHAVTGAFGYSMAGLLATESPPIGKTVLTDWICEHVDTLGRRYTSELARRKDRTVAYESN